MQKRSHLPLLSFTDQTIWRGNQIDALNTFDFLMNPIGGTVNGTFSQVSYFKTNFKIQNWTKSLVQNGYKDSLYQILKALVFLITTAV